MLYSSAISTGSPILAYTNVLNDNKVKIARDIVLISVFFISLPPLKLSVTKRKKNIIERNPSLSTIFFKFSLSYYILKEYCH